MEKEFRSLLAVKKIYPDTYQIVDPGIGFGGVNMYLLVGSDKALLIDSGYGALPIMQPDGWQKIDSHFTDARFPILHMPCILAANPINCRLTLQKKYET